MPGSYLSPTGPGTHHPSAGQNRRSPLLALLPPRFLLCLAPSRFGHSTWNAACVGPRSCGRTTHGTLSRPPLPRRGTHGAYIVGLLAEDRLRYGWPRRRDGARPPPEVERLASPLRAGLPPL